MKVSGKHLAKERAEAKKASRRADRERLERGEDPAVIQQENSIFPKEFFKNGQFSNLRSAVGK